MFFNNNKDTKLYDILNVKPYAIKSEIKKSRSDSNIILISYIGNKEESEKKFKVITVL